MNLEEIENSLENTRKKLVSEIDFQKLRQLGWSKQRIYMAKKTSVLNLLKIAKELETTNIIRYDRKTNIGSNNVRKIQIRSSPIPQ